MGPISDEAKRLARQLLFEEAARIKFPSRVRRCDEDGELTFAVTVNTGVGDAVVFYKPQAAAERIAQTCFDWVGAAGEASEELLPDFRRDIIRASIGHLLETFHAEFNDAVENLPELAFAASACIFDYALQQSKAQFKWGRPDKRSPNRLIDAALAAADEGRRARLEVGLMCAHAYFTPSFTLLHGFYTRLKPIWEEAKSCYKRNRTSPKWREMVRAACDSPEVELPSDLINRLDAKRGFFDSYKAMPSALALEHAARLCGARPNAYNTRRLHEFLKKSEKEFDWDRWEAEHMPEDLGRRTNIGEVENTAEASHAVRSKIVESSAESGT